MNRRQNWLTRTANEHRQHQLLLDDIIKTMVAAGDLADGSIVPVTHADDRLQMVRDGYGMFWYHVRDISPRGTTAWVRFSANPKHSGFVTVDDQSQIPN